MYDCCCRNCVEFNPSKPEPLTVFTVTDDPPFITLPVNTKLFTLRLISLTETLAVRGEN